jgi:hypothetical protein
LHILIIHTFSLISVLFLVFWGICYRAKFIFPYDGYFIFKKRKTFSRCHQPYRTLKLLRQILLIWFMFCYFSITCRLSCCSVMPKFGSFQSRLTKFWRCVIDWLRIPLALIIFHNFTLWDNEISINSFPVQFHEIFYLLSA